MKITAVGFLTLVVAAMVLGLVIYEVGSDLDKNRRKSNEQSNGSY